MNRPDHVTVRRYPLRFVEFIALRPPLYPEYDPPAYDDIEDDNHRDQLNSSKLQRQAKSFIRNEANDEAASSIRQPRLETPRNNNSALRDGLLRRSNAELELSCHSNATNGDVFSGLSSASTVNIRSCHTRCHGNVCSRSAHYQPVSMTPDTVEATQNFSQFSLSIR